MKKLLLLTLAIVTLTSLGYSQSSPTKKNDWEENNLKGKVKSFSEYRFWKIQKTLLEKETYKYDVKGYFIEQNRYSADGKLDNKYTYKYDDKGNLIEQNGYIADGSLKKKETFEFDKKGNWTKKIRFKNQIPENIEEREYEYYE